MRKSCGGWSWMRLEGEMPTINDYINRLRNVLFSNRKQRSGIAFIDIEVGLRDKKVRDFGAVKESGEEFHSASKQGFSQFVVDAEFLCGHNIIHHDLKYLTDIVEIKGKKAIGTLYLSPLLFPKRPYHKLLKDDKLQTDEVNNPLNDCLKAQTLFYDEENAFEALSNGMKAIFYGLLHGIEEFVGFFNYLDFSSMFKTWNPLFFSFFKEKSANIALSIH